MKGDKKVRSIEKQIAKLKKDLSKARDKIKPEWIEQDYEFLSDKGRAVTLSSLFGSKNELILVHNMGSSCPYCTLWADGFNGLLTHLEDRAAFVVESADRFVTMNKFKESRGWKFKMVSSHGSSFRLDMGYSDKKDGPWPGVSAFIKKNGKIYRVSDTGFGPGDNYCSAWDLFDLLPGPALQWEAKFKY